jgi:Beta-propeller repeat
MSRWSFAAGARLAATRRRLVPLALVVLGAVTLTQFGGTPGDSRGSGAADVGAAPVSASSDGSVEAYAQGPLSFVTNAGQTDGRVRFLARAPGVDFYFTPQEAVFAFSAGGADQLDGVVLRLAFVGANPAATIEGQRRAAGTVNYLVGSDPARWRTGLPTYERVAYRDLWPGIDLVFRGEGGTLKYEFHLDPGARVSDIRLVYRGAERLALERGSDLLVHTPLGILRDARPRSYQVTDGGRVPVESRYLLGPGAGYGFALGAGHDPRRPLVIDPGLVYSTFLGDGGPLLDDGLGIAVDPSGYAYVTGRAGSGDFPTTAGAFDTTFGGVFDAFVAKLSRDGSSLVYSTFLGGASVDEPSGIAVDPQGQAYVIGSTQSGDFPATPGAFDTALDGTEDAFVTKISRDGSALAYSTFLGGSSDDFGSGIAVDPSGQAFVTGRTESGDFLTTPGAFDTTFGGGLDDGFVTKLSRDGSALAYSTFLGGAAFDFGEGIAVDPSGYAYVTGLTESGDFPTTAAFNTTLDDVDAFVAKLSRDGSTLAYSTFLGGAFNDIAFGIAVDPSGQAYVAGRTSSGDFPTTAGAFDTTFGGGFSDAFVARLTRDGSALAYATFLGGAFDDAANGIAIDPSGHAYVTGFTQSGEFPITAGAFDTTLGFIDAFVTKLSRDGSTLGYSTFLGGAVNDGGNGIAVDPSGQAYVTGFTQSADFPTTAGAFDTTFGGGFFDAFVTKLDTR